MSEIKRYINCGAGFAEEFGNINPRLNYFGTSREKSLFGFSRGFNGTSDYISINNLDTLSYSNNPRTFLIKFKRDSINSNINTLFSYGTDLSGEKFDISIMDTDKFVVDINGGIYGGTIPQDLEWHYSIVVFPSGSSNIDDIQLYYDSSLLSASLLSGSIIPVNTTKDFGYIGQNFDGQLEEIISFGREFSSEEIEDYFKNQTFDYSRIIFNDYDFYGSLTESIVPSGAYYSSLNKKSNPLADLGLTQIQLDDIKARYSSWINNFTTSSNILDYLAWLQNGTNDGTNLLEKVGTIDPVQIVNRPVLTFDGVGDRIEYDLGTGISSNELGAGTIKASVIFTDLTGNHCVFAYGNTAYRFYYSTSSGHMVVNSQDTGFSPSSNTVYDFEVDFNADGEGVAMRVNGTEEWSGIASAGSAYAGKGLIFGARYNGSYNLLLEGELWGLGFDAVTYPGFAFNSPCEEDGEEICYDVSGNGNHGTITSTTAGIDTVRSGRADVPSYNAQYGHSIALYNDAVSYWDSGIQADETTSATLQFRLRQVINGKYILGGYGSQAYEKFLFYVSGVGNFTFVSPVVALSTGIPADTEWHTVTLDAVNDKAYLDGAEYSLDFTGLAQSSQSIKFLGFSTKSDGELSRASITKASTAYTYIPQLDGTLLIEETGSSISPDSTYTAFRVPALSDGSTDALGNDIQYAGGYPHNNGGYDIIWPDGLGVSDELCTSNDGTDISGWTQSGATLSLEGGQFKLTSSSSGGNTWWTVTGTSGGEKFNVSFEGYLGTDSALRYAVYDQTHSSFIIPQTTYDEGLFAFSFIVPDGCTAFRVYPLRGIANGIYSYFDNVSIRRVYPHSDLYDFALSGTDVNGWKFSYDDNNNIVDGIYYSPSLSGSDLTQLNDYLNSKHT